MLLVVFRPYCTRIASLPEGVTMSRKLAESLLSVQYTRKS